LVAMKLIDSISNDLKTDLSFEDVAKKYSQDKRSAVNGGDIGWFSTGRLFRNLEKNAFLIKNIGDYLGPVRSPAGYHFIKLLDRVEYGSFNEEKEDLIIALKKSNRYLKVEENIIEKLKKEFEFTQIEPLEEFYSEIDSSIFIAKWKADKFKNDKRVLATFTNKKLSFEDFAYYLEKNQTNIYKKKFDESITKKYNEFVNINIKDYQINQLKKNNSYFKNLSQEYHDGLLLFDITNDMVWSKAISDTAGLKQYYSKNRNKYNQKLYLTIFNYSDEKSMKKTVKLLKKKDKKGLNDSMIVDIINKKNQLISIEQNGMFMNGDDESVDYTIDLMKNNKIDNNQNIVIDSKNKKIILIKNNISDIKGLVTADYQDVLEKEWIKQMRKKYKIEINQDILNKTKKELLNR
ncbi:MAG: peptidylprolyl isomerase, partial [Bacteroidota bacterium]|nr:peptidylprolyl isomerase [Bacteroidota bacterium]